MTEREWKVLRALMPIALDRYCERVLGECRAVMDDTRKSHHERYLRLYRLIQERDRSLANAFNDPRRSNALFKLASLRGLELLTEEEFERFEPGTRETVEVLPK